MEAHNNNNRNKKENYILSPFVESDFCSPGFVHDVISFTTCPVLIWQCCSASFQPFEAWGPVLIVWLLKISTGPLSHTNEGKKKQQQKHYMTKNTNKGKLNAKLWGDFITANLQLFPPHCLYESAFKDITSNIWASITEQFLTLALVTLHVVNPLEIISSYPKRLATISTGFYMQKSPIF